MKTFVPELDRSRTCGVGVIDPAAVTAEDLELMQDAGIRGIWVEFYQYCAMHNVELQKLALRDHAAILKQHCPRWSMAFTHIHPEFWAELTSVVKEIATAGILVVTDHFALLKASSMLPERLQHDPTSQPGFADILSLVPMGGLYVKLSPPYRISDMAPAYSDIRPIVKALVEANPRRVLWGSDWPHYPRMRVKSHEEALKETPFLVVDDEAWLRSLKSWLTNEQWDLVMVKNPSELYGSK